jgi:chemotaxis protein methyltransferase CheR
MTPPTLPFQWPGLADRERLTVASYRLLQHCVYETAGIVIEDNREDLLYARLQPVARATGAADLNALCRQLESGRDASLRAAVVDALTTNETLFFRDSSLWTALESTVFPELVERRKATRWLRIWSAASSSGQEAYSVLMMLLDMGLADWRIDVLGTDISSQMIARARAGRYSQLEVNRGLPVRRLLDHFERDGMEWELRRETRARARFEPFDLRADWRRFGCFDLIFCRNVLIYFDPPTKSRILGQAHHALVPGGYLVLGAAETTWNLDNRFSRRQVGTATFYRSEEARP